MPRLAYLCSQYPAVSHTFILREVDALRRLGVAIDTFSIHRAGAEQLLADADRVAFETTHAILPARWSSLLSTHVRVAARAPRAYAATLRFALRLAAPGPRGRLWQLFYFAESVMLWGECRRRGIRHIHAHLANVAADVALLAAKLGSAVEPERPWSWSFTMHGPTEFFDVGRFRLAHKLQHARFVVCISDYARSQLMAVSEPATWERLHVIRCGVPLEQFTRSVEPPASGAAQRRDDAPTVLCIGRLVPEKGQAILLQAAALLLERGNSFRVTFVGEGPSRPGLERLARELRIARRVVFTGALGQDEIQALYRDASVFALPSFAEGIPIVLMEAMAMSIAVVSTRIAGIPELIADGRSGLLVSAGRADELADALERLLVEPSLGRTIGSSASAKVIEEFNLSDSAERLRALFADQLTPSPGTPLAGAPSDRARRPRPHDAPSARPAPARGRARRSRAPDHAHPRP